MPRSQPTLLAGAALPPPACSKKAAQVSEEAGLCPEPSPPPARLPTGGHPGPLAEPCTTEQDGEEALDSVPNALPQTPADSGATASLPLADRANSRASSRATASTAPTPTLEPQEGDDILLQMSGDMLCLRTMHVAYTDRTGRRHRASQAGYNVKIHLSSTVRDVEVTFTVVGGNHVKKVDRTDSHRKWLKDVNGQSIPERFLYATCPPHVQYFIRGPSLKSWVSAVDEREKSESLLELVSRDFHCVRTMHVSYVDPKGERQHWACSGYNVKCHLPSHAQDVEVTFSVVGGRSVHKVDRRDPELPWVQDANGQRPRERFFYPRCPQSVLYDIRGTSLFAFISHVSELRTDGTNSVHPSTGSLTPRVDSEELFASALDEVPPVGGVVDLKEPHSEFLLPAEVVLFEPTVQEFFWNGKAEKPGGRQIFLNTPLREAEIAALAEFHRLLAKRGIGGEGGDFPRYMEVHALRILQTCKFNPSRAVDMMKICLKERVRRLPMVEADVAEDLKTGFIYWHGRDRKCRPCLVINLARIGEIARDKERAVRMVIFTLEYGLRFAMVPGRVENWVAIIDLANVSSILSPLYVGSMIATAAAIGQTLEKVYCGRMVWIKIVNMPGSAFLGRALNSMIPAEKKDKVSCPQSLAAELAPHFEPNQLERRYGGAAKDLEPGETYPFHFFPNARGEEASRRRHHEDAAGQPEAAPGVGPREPEEFSMHEQSSLAFHEGHLWDDSSAANRARWLEGAKASSLTPAAAEALSGLAGEPVEPCRTVARWLELVNPAVADQQGSRRESSESDGMDTVETPSL